MFSPETQVDELINDVAHAREASPGIDTVERRKRELGRAMTNLSHFLNLGIYRVALGGIGIASAFICT